MQLLSVARPLPSIEIVIPSFFKCCVNGYKVSLNTVTRYRQELGLKAVLAVKQVNDALEKHPHPEIFNTDQGAKVS
jgi:hypothetical protein